MRRSFFASALTAGLVAGALDIVAACLNAYIKNETPPMQVLRGVASGAFDPKTFSSDALLALCGLLIHFFIAISFTFFFFFLAKQMPSLVKYPIPIGILYGLFVWATMRFISLPYLSRLNPKPIAGKEAINNAIIAAEIIIVCVGMPVVFLARRFLYKYYETKNYEIQQNQNSNNLANGIITAIIGIALIIIAQTISTEYEIKYGEVIADATTKNLVLYPGLALLVSGGIVTAIALTKNKKN